MFSQVEYHSRMRRLNRATVAGFGLVLSSALLVATAAAQINGTPSSVTSTGFGGIPGSIHGAAPSVTSLGPQGYTPRFQQFPTNNGLFGVTSNFGINGNGHRHHHGNVSGWGWGYGVPYYGYGYSDNGDYAGDAPADDQYNGGPTVFDRRGPGTPARPPASYSASAAPGPQDETASEPAPAAPVSNQPHTVLVFKDGHQIEVENYAIIGNTLYNLSEGRRQKIALADLDLTATAKQNDDRGIDFQLPGAAQAN